MQFLSYQEVDFLFPYKINIAVKGDCVTASLHRMVYMISCSSSSILYQMVSFLSFVSPSLPSFHHLLFDEKERESHHPHQRAI